MPLSDQAVSKFLPLSLAGRTIAVDPFMGGPRQVVVDEHVLFGPYTDLWRATDETGRVWGLRMLPNKEVHAQAWVHVLRMGGCDHPNVARIMGRVRVEGVPGLIRDWVEGQPLDDFWPSNAPIGDVEDVFRRILSAVKAAHRYPVIHGGLKPSRVLVNRQTNTLKVLDFAMGPWLPPRPEDGPWLAPERRETFEADERGDIYALGAMLYWLATGVQPQRTPIPVRKLRPDLPEGLRKAIEGAMHPDREQRFPSCGLIQDLVGLSRSEQSLKSTNHFPSVEDADEGTQQTEEQTVEELWADHGSGAGIPSQPPTDARVPSLPRLPPLPDIGTVYETKPPPPPAPPLPPQPVISPILYWVSGGLLLLVILAAVTLVVQRERGTEPGPGNVKPPAPPPPITVNTVFEFAGSSQPDSVVVTCNEDFQAEAPLQHGRAVIATIPAVNGCSMYPLGVPVLHAVPVSQGNQYRCTIDRDVLSCTSSALQH